MSWFEQRVGRTFMLGALAAAMAATPADPAVSALPVAAPSGYRAVELTPLGALGSDPLDIDDRGLIAGGVELVARTTQPALWRRPTEAPEILAEDQGFATMLGGRRVVVGAVDDPDTGVIAVAWRRGVQFPIGHPESAFGVPVDADRRGNVLLTSLDGFSGVQRVWTWQNGTITELSGFPEPVGAPFDWSGSQPSDRNERGQIVGTFSVADAGAYLWETGAVRYLPSLTGPPGATDARAINDRGQIAGTSVGVDGLVHPVLWHRGRIVDIGLLPDTTACHVFHQRSLSQAGHVIGTCTTADGATRGFLWHRGRLLDLGDLGGTFVEPAAVNSRGQVVGRATTSDGRTRAFLWHNGHMTDLPINAESSRAGDINEAGDIIGATTDLPHVRGILWTQARP